MSAAENPRISTVQPQKTLCLVHEITEIAKFGLVKMFDSRSQLFCYTLRRNSQGSLVQRGISHRYTMMTLLGLHRLEQGGAISPVPIRPVMNELTRNLNWVKYGGDLGVLLWLCAVVDPERAGALMRSGAFVTKLSAYHDVWQRSTTALAWLLAGLSHAKQAGISAIPELDALAGKFYELLKENQGDHGIFGHQARNASMTGWLRGRAGSFADQVYPIYALAHYGMAYGDAEAIGRAGRCADAILRMHGPQGEWWWHYDSVTGEVLRPYPVFSVHQHGMAPMALFALEEATGADYSAAVDSGLRWIRNANALGADLIYPAGGLVWRCIESDNRRAKFEELCQLYFGMQPRHELTSARVKYECRPYELGWALYAFANRQPKTALPTKRFAG